MEFPKIRDPNIHPTQYSSYYKDTEQTDPQLLETAEEFMTTAHTHTPGQELLTREAEITCVADGAIVGPEKITRRTALYTNLRSPATKLAPGRARSSFR